MRVLLLIIWALALSVGWKICDGENMEDQVACVDWHLLQFNVYNRVFSGVSQYKFSMMERIISELITSNTQCDEEYYCYFFVRRNHF